MPKKIGNTKIATLIILVLLFLYGTNLVLDKKEPPKEAGKVSLDNEDRIILRYRGEDILSLEISDTDKERMLGLSYRSAMNEDEGMLFVFEEEGRYGFWMKEMYMSIDIAWLDSEKRIVHIERDVSPESYPKVFYPESEALYVIETVPNFFDKKMIKIGDKLEF